MVDSFKLRWLAQEIGIEKLVIKSGKMIGYFVSNPQSKYYESSTFTKVLDYMQRSAEAKLSEKNDRLRIIYSDVNSIEQAKELLGRV